MTGVGAGGFMSVVLNGPDDYVLQILDAKGLVLATSDRGDQGVEEALQLEITATGTYDVRVTIRDCADSGSDINDDCTVGVQDFLDVLAAWGQPGGPADVNDDGTVDTVDFLTVLADWGTIENEYLLEILSRDG